MNRLLSTVIVSALAFSACGASQDGRSAARLERELRQARAEEAMAHAAPLETRTEMFEQAIAEAEARREKIAKVDDAPAPPAAEPRAISSADLPIAPGHLVQSQCLFPAERTVCVKIPGEVSRNDEVGEERLVADYVERFKADGWRVIQEGLWPVLMKASHCVRLEALLWDDGKSARMRFYRILRVEFDPEGVACGG